jgi:hypothetical protein
MEEQRGGQTAAKQWKREWERERESGIEEET